MFPFSNVRDVQKDFMNDIKSALDNKKHLIAHAPTGIGKTAATLAQCLEYAIENDKTIFFLTPKHSQHQIAVETLRMIKRKHGPKFIAADIIGKKWLCSQIAVDEMTNSEFNNFCRAMVKDERCDYYNDTRTISHTLKRRAGQLLLDMKQRQPLHAEECKELAQESFCSYEILMELAKKSNIIIGDYFHVFSPLRKAIFSRIGKKIEDSIFIVDEAHNLPGRVRSLLSKKISTLSIKTAEREAQAFGYYDLRNEILGLGNILKDLGNKVDHETFVKKNEFLDLVENRIYNIAEFLEDLTQASDAVLEEKKKSSLGNIARFIESWSGEDIGFSRILTRTKKFGKNIDTLSYNCLDPALLTKEIINDSHSTILMSGTLSPMEMYRNLLGFPEDRTLVKSYKSPFPRKNRLNLFVRGVTTKYSQRGAQNYKAIADYVEKCANTIPGNVAVFFPSYKMRDEFYKVLKLKKHIILERQGADKKEKRRIYNLFVSMADQGAVLLGVQAGSFSEGIDLPGKYLNGVIVVGVPLDIPNLETKSLIDYYDYKFKRGWDYGYIYPAMIRSIQATGRCIRSEKDRGVCVFLDERFLWGNYRKVLPSDLKIQVSQKPEQDIEEFFRVH